MEQKWWELLTEDEVEVISKEFPNYKEYEFPIMDMKTLLDFYYLKTIKKFVIFNCSKDLMLLPQ